MTKTLSVLAAIPFLFASVAFAETASPGPAAAPAEHHAVDRAAWHKKVCGELYAHQAAHLAYLEAKLDLTEAQRPLWTKWKQAHLDAAAKHRSACLEAGPKGDTRPTALEREALIEKILTAKLQTLQATRPALVALYDALTPEQKAVFDHASHHHGAHGMREHGQGHGESEWHHHGQPG